jgi:hypothetical protein
VLKRRIKFATPFSTRELEKSPSFSQEEWEMRTLKLKGTVA